MGSDYAAQAQTRPTDELIAQLLDLADRTDERATALCDVPAFARMAIRDDAAAIRELCRRLERQAR